MVLNSSVLSQPLLTRIRFDQLRLADPFFDSLKADYQDFEAWFARKAKETAWVMRDASGGIIAFLYLKLEGADAEDAPSHWSRRDRMKIGTFKILPHGTRLGERFIKRALDETIAAGLNEVYLTVFPKHKALIDLITRYGFVEDGEKVSNSGREILFRKTMPGRSGNIMLDYPTIHLRGRRKFLLAIYPDYHTQLLPDSILTNETFDILDDISHTNSIHKIYICWMRGVETLRPGDVLLLYRTSDKKGLARYRSVATSVGVVEERRGKGDFPDLESFLRYCAPHSVFGEAALRGYWNKPGDLSVIRFLYNAALRKRVTRDNLITQAHLDADRYFGFLSLTDIQFQTALDIGQVPQGLVVD